MLPFTIALMIACAVWFYSVAAMAGRGVGVRIGLALLGVVEFLIVAVVLELVLEKFYPRATQSGPSPGSFMMFVLPCIILVFLSGLWLKKLLIAPAVPGTEEDQAR